MMKLRKQVQPATKMYGVKTSSGLLDNYVNKNSESIPSDIESMLKEKSVEIG